MKRLTHGGIWMACAAAVIVLGGRSPRAQDAQQPTFRASVDLVAVNVQVVDSNGRPVAALGPDKFDVTIGGKHRRVVSADFLETGTEPVPGTVRVPTTGAITTNLWPSTTPGQTFVLAIDVGSFGVDDSRGAMAAASTFLQQLQPNDLVGLFAFPVGPHVDPTLDHAAVAHALDSIVGSRESIHSEFHLTPAEIIDINSEITSTGMRLNLPSRSVNTNQQSLIGAETPTLQRISARECDGDITPQNVACVEQIMQEASSLGLYYEAQVTEGLSQIHGLLGQLSHTPGRKTIVVVSAGMPTSDRPGGRPDVATVAIDIGKNAAEANATIYAVYIDSEYLRSFSAENRKTDKIPANRAREDSVKWRLLDQFSGAAGGTLIKDLVGNGEIGFDRVLRETSAYYLLGVEPTDADRDGRTRELKVKVNAPGVTVRSRTWVALPKKS